ncbi:Galactoside O-acetyltransferase [plant metagenome]|uniref:Galactoside O-acetyltransferase n=1 Tax=plant metagenome TaxID=1297885 RepID=A0A484PJM2_9ZZZZ
MISIHDSARVSKLADIEDSVRGTRILIGARSVVDAFVKIKPAGGAGDILIGEDCVINAGCVLYSGHGISMGDRVAIAANCTLAPTNHEFADASKPIRSQGFRPSKGGVRIGDDAWIGANCVLLDGADIGEGAVIGAGSVVRGKVEPYTVHAGNPLRQLGTRQPLSE